MSASDKKKLRKEQKAELLTQRQQQEQAEAKKLKLYTIAFSAVIAVIVCICVVSLVISTVSHSGIVEKNTIAAVVDGQELNSVEMTYYYNDAINQMYNSAYESMGESYADMYLEAMGLQLGTPLDEQEHPDGGTWAEYFVNAALDNAKSDIAIYNKAKEAGYTMDEVNQANLDVQISNLKNYAPLYGYSTADAYIQAIYGYGSDLASYSKYLERSAIASAYYNEHMNSLEYASDDLRAFEKGNEANYNSYTYDYCYLSYNDFITGGSENEAGATTYSDEEKDAARAKAKEAAEKLATATTVEEMKALIEEIELNESSELAVNSEERILHTSVNSSLSTWLNGDERTAGEVGVIENATTGDDSVVNGYYVAIFGAKYDNTKPMSNVRHLLVAFSGGTTDDLTGETVYTDEEKATAQTAAKAMLEKWESGELTEDRFIELVKEHSDDTGSVEDGGLIANIHPDSQLVPSFLSWSIDESRKVGDYELIESQYGYHLMFYAGEAEMSYRDYMISEELKATDIEDWYNEAVEAISAELKDISKLNVSLVLGGDHDHEDEE